MSYSRSVAQSSATSVASLYMRQVYQWMTAGLAVTTVVAYAVASSPAVQAAIFGNTIVLVLMLVAQFGLESPFRRRFTKCPAARPRVLPMLMR